MELPDKVELSEEPKATTNPMHILTTNPIRWNSKSQPQRKIKMVRKTYILRALDNEMSPVLA